MDGTRYGIGSEGEGALLALARRAGMLNPSYEFREGLHVLTYYSKQGMSISKGYPAARKCVQAFTFADTMVSYLLRLALAREAGE